MVKTLNIGMRKCSDDDGEDFSSGKFSSVYFPLFLLLFLSFYSEGYLSKIGFCSVQFRLVQFSCSVLSDSVTPWTEAWQASLSFTNSQSLLKLTSIELVMHPTISSSVIHFSSCPQPFPASGSFPGSQLFASGGQSIGASASASVLPMNIQDHSIVMAKGLV